jgi:hypothetical protein
MAESGLEEQAERACGWNDALTMGSYVGVKNITIKDAMSTLAGPFCYIYA